MQNLNFGIEFVITVVGGILTTGAAVFGIMRKISKFANSVENNSKSITVISDTIKEDRKRLDAIDLLKKDIDTLHHIVDNHTLQIDTINRDVMTLSNSVLMRLSDELKPIAKSIELLTEKTIQGEAAINYFKESFAEMRTTIRDIKDEALNRPCITHRQNI